MAEEARVLIRYLRIGPRKMRLVIDTIRNRPVAEALARLAALKNKGASLAKKALRSAVANAKQLQMREDALYVARIVADGGPVLKRFMTRAMGRADRMLRRTTHLSIVLREVVAPAVPETRREKKATTGMREKSKPSAAVAAKKPRQRRLAKASA